MPTASAELLVDAFSRIRDAVHGAVEGLDEEQLTHRIDPDANTIAWLVWHLTRIEDDHVADAFGLQQVWLSAGWVDRFGLPFEPKDHGYGHTRDDVASVAVGSDLLLGYQDAVHDHCVAQLAKLTDDDLARIVDRRWDPPVTLSVRLVSVIADGLEHAGQAAYARGIIERR